jgi:hypothetical protein
MEPGSSPPSSQKLATEPISSYFTSLKCEDPKWQPTFLLQAYELPIFALGLPAKFETTAVSCTMKATVQ